MSGQIFNVIKRWHFSLLVRSFLLWWIFYFLSLLCFVLESSFLLHHLKWHPWCPLAQTDTPPSKRVGLDLPARVQLDALCPGEGCHSPISITFFQDEHDHSLRKAGLGSELSCLLLITVSGEVSCPASWDQKPWEDEAFPVGQRGCQSPGKLSSCFISPCLFNAWVINLKKRL